MKEKVYWTMKDGKKIDVDEMTESHLRNTLKMIIRNSERFTINEEFERYKNERIRDLKNDEPYAFDYRWK